MSDDSPFPPSKRGTNPRSLGNLRPAAKGEPSRNPLGNNGRTRAETVAKFLEETDDTAMGKALLSKVGCPGGTRIMGLLQREWLAGMGKSDIARKTLIEQYAGKPKQQVDLSNDDGSMRPTESKVSQMNSEQRAKRRAELLAKASGAATATASSGAPQPDGASS